MSPCGQARKDTLTQVHTHTHTQFLKQMKLYVPACIESSQHTHTHRNTQPHTHTPEAISSSWLVKRELLIASRGQALLLLLVVQPWCRVVFMGRSLRRSRPPSTPNSLQSAPPRQTHTHTHTHTHTSSLRGELREWNPFTHSGHRFHGRRQ